MSSFQKDIDAVGVVFENSYADDAQSEALDRIIELAEKAERVAKAAQACVIARNEAGTPTLISWSVDFLEAVLALRGSETEPCEVGVEVRQATDEEQREALDKAIETQHRIARKLEATGKADMERFARRFEERSNVHAKAEAGTGAPAPSREDASKAEVESRPLGVPPAAGAPPTFESAGPQVPASARTEVR